MMLQAPAVSPGPVRAQTGPVRAQAGPVRAQAGLVQAQAEAGAANAEHAGTLVQLLAGRGVRCSQSGLERYLGAPISVGRQSKVFEFVCGGDGHLERVTRGAGK